MESGGSMKKLNDMGLDPEVFTDPDRFLESLGRALTSKEWQEHDSESYVRAMGDWLKVRSKRDRASVEVEILDDDAPVADGSVSNE